jgi:hypothetical protein
VNNEDRELLEYAAKAAGVELKYDTFGQGPNAAREYCYWNPLTDDGDAFRLMVRLQLCITNVYCYYDEHRQSPTTVVSSGGGKLDDITVSFPTYRASFQKHDPCTATRRAITRAAAEIGRRMES